MRVARVRAWHNGIFFSHAYVLVEDLERIKAAQIPTKQTDPHQEPEPMPVTHEQLTLF